jgi:hypothetical protein
MKLKECARIDYALRKSFIFLRLKFMRMGEDYGSKNEHNMTNAILL